MATHDKCFILVDADFDLAASVSAAEGGQPDYVTIMAPSRDQFITMRADDFRRMSVAVINAVGGAA